MKSIKNNSEKIKHIFFLISIFIVFSLILLEPKTLLLGNPDAIHLQSIAESISRIVFNLGKNYYFEGIYDHIYQNYYSVILNEKYLQYISLFGYNILNTDETKNFLNLISNLNSSIKIEEFLSADKGSIVINFGKNQSLFIFYFLSFKIFGLKLSSLLYGYLLVFLIAILILYLNFYKNLSNYIIIQFFLYSFVIIILINVGGSYETLGLYNYRSLNFLSMIPALFFSFLLFAEKIKINYFLILGIIFNSLILGWTISLREIDLWIILNLTIIFLLYICFFKKNKYFIKKIIIFFISIIFIFSTFSYIDYSKNFVLKEKKLISEDNRMSHGFWHSIVTGLVKYPNLKKKYSCVTDDIIIEKYSLTKLICESDPKKSIFFYIKNYVLERNDDNNGYNAIKLHLLNSIDNKQQDNLVKNLPLHWSLYEETSKNLLIKILREDTLEVFSIVIFWRPLEILYTLIKFSHHFLNSLLSNNYNLLFFTLSNVVLFKIIRFAKRSQDSFSKNHFFKDIILVLSLLFSSCTIPIIFFVTPQSNMFQLTSLLIIIFLLIINKFILLKSNRKKNFY